MKIKPMSTETMRTLLQHCPTGVLALDHQRRILWANPALENLLGAVPGTLAGRSVNTVGREDWQALFSDAAHLTVAGFNDEPRHLIRTRVAGETGDDLAELHYFSDQTELQRLHQELAQAREEAESLRLVETDTGLMSHRALMLVLEPQVARSRRYDNPLAALVLHAESDAAAAPQVAAREVRHVLRDQLRWADLVGRDDDGDFLIVLPETDREAALALAEKLTQSLDRLPCLRAAYFGVAQWGKTDNAAGLLQRARAALQLAREGGAPIRSAG